MLISVIVKTGVKNAPKIISDAEGGLIIYLREKPHDGEANQALIKLLAKYYGVSKSQVEIKAGVKSHNKKVEIIGI